MSEDLTHAIPLLMPLVRRRGAKLHWFEDEAEQKQQALLSAWLGSSNPQNTDHFGGYTQWNHSELQRRLDPSQGVLMMSVIVESQGAKTQP